MQTAIVMVIIGLSVYYVVRCFIKSFQDKKTGHCSGCRKE
ncbi:MAG: FeoB-associated Cys-rich membrane protein [Candidatus Omnitrophica bacterium]|nr:FeoB-associated Cys-rich membrane protein [Candidatus Omnitrophota bacterium]